MQQIDVALRHNRYRIYIGNGEYDAFPRILGEHLDAAQLAVISTGALYEMYGTHFLGNLKQRKDLVFIPVPDGEQAKSLKQADRIYTQLLKKKCERNTVIIALGGGVIGDLAGFIAATFLRGVRFVQVPTTLLAQVDSSIGGKVGINHPLGKNLIGAFKQPLFVFSEIDVLKTLEPAELRCGLGEVIKYGFIRDAGLFGFLETHLDEALAGSPAILQHLVQVSSTIKASVVSEDEFEQGLRMILNFGHTFGHALEAEAQFSGIKHGEAVILGMKCAMEYARITGKVDGETFGRCLNLLNRVPVSLNASGLRPERLVKHMALDKKVASKTIRLVLAPRPGTYLIEHVADRNMLLKSWEIVI